jgi:hypothetical protein
VKLWIDECLSPALVDLAHDLGYEATCTRDRGYLHAGLIVLPQGSREAQLGWLRRAVAHVERRAAEIGESPGDWMLNRVVEVRRDDESCIDAELPDR